MVFNNNLLLGAGGQSTGPVFDPTLIGNSVWLEGASDYFSKTYAGSGNSTTEAIFAFWYQRYNFGVAQTTWFEASGFGGLQTNTSYGGGDTLVVNSFDAGGTQVIARHTRLLRDTSWYHIIVSIDMSQATTLDKIKFYINGEQDTTINVQNLATTNGLDMLGARSKVNFRIGENTGSAGHAYAQFCYLDGVSIQQGDYVVSDFLDTFTFGTNGSQIIPKANADIASLASTVGGNSICLDFADSADLGNDISSNANDFTANSMSSANQSTNTPSKVYPTFNPLTQVGTSKGTFSEGNTKVSLASDNGAIVTTTLPSSGMWYLEIDWSSGANGIYPGIALQSAIGNTASSPHTRSDTFVWLAGDASGRAYDGSSLVSYVGSATSIGRIAVAFDADNTAMYFGTVSGSTITWLASGDPTSGSSKTGAAPFTLPTDETLYLFHSTGSASIAQYLFEEDDWTGVTNRPANAKSLSSENLPVPDYQGIDYFNATLYTGNGTAIGSGGKAVTGVGFQPDFTWIKNRDAADSHILTDVMRGVTKYMSSDSTAAEVTNTESLSTFDTDGFTVGNLAAVNTNTEDYVSWNWLAGGTGSSNTDGSITSTVTVANAGHLSIGTYTGTGANATVGHGLSGAPELVIVKNTNDSRAWRVLETIVNGGTHYLTLNTTAASTAGSTFWNDSNPTASVINLGSDTDTNDLGDTMVAIAFRSVPGVCKVGSYEGNGSTDGTIVSLGFKPAFVLFKSIDSTSDWQIFDKSRNGFNIRNNELEANDSAIEDTSTNFIDLLSDGFKFRIATDPNVSETYLYLAMAEIGGNGTLPPIYGR